MNMPENRTDAGF